MSNYINGTSYPIIQVRTVSNGDLYDSVSLDLCMGNGLVETYQESFKSVLLENEKIVYYDFKGSRISFELNYSEYVRKANLFLIEKIFHYNSLPDIYYLEIIPASDLLERVFRVVLEDGTYSLGHLSGGVLARGHKFPVIKFLTVFPVGKNFIDQDLLYIAMPFCSVS